MGRITSALLLLAVAVCYEVAVASGEGERREERFVLRDMKRVVKTDAGEMKVVRGSKGWISEWPNIHVGDELIERRLKSGDVYRIPAGSTFYLVNIADGQQLDVICSIEKSDSIGWGTFQSFFIGGGSYPTSVLAGFERSTLSTALNVSESQVSRILTGQSSGPIISLSNTNSNLDSHQSRVWTQFLEMRHHERVQCLKRMAMHSEEEETEKEQEPIVRSFRKLLNSVFGKELSGNDVGRSSKKPHSYNLFNKKPDFENDYGSSVALDQSDYSPLRHSGVGLYLVNLNAGSMMAPHFNPTATEYGIVLRGSGTIQIVFPNGTLATNAQVSEGDVFWIPRYFPFCQIASGSGPFEFFGFTTSARGNRPQFLVGSNSVLQSMRGPAFAAAFGVSEERLKKIVNAQSESIILPPGSASAEKAKNKRVSDMTGSFDDEMVMGFEGIY
ncbi:hypothetical protein RHGRI_002351 [Rhododendron griersonianum]|uniref:Cupin type-1 domain-containing protein n=1 Tax=Rhododendron griersonianum TaxID=479676 RepID=A0AAV6LPA7_9ERIC|nr:hypothetical protein RHGRI_002351 [Rhododendron griersonianum]